MDVIDLHVNDAKRKEIKKDLEMIIEMLEDK